MAEGSGDLLKCPGCGYSTRVWDDDGHAEICPECGEDGLFPVETAQRIQYNRVPDSEFDALVFGDFEAARNAETGIDRDDLLDSVRLSMDWDPTDAHYGESPVERMAADLEHHGPTLTGPAFRMEIEDSGINTDELRDAMEREAEKAKDHWLEDGDV